MDCKILWIGVWRVGITLYKPQRAQREDEKQFFSLCSLWFTVLFRVTMFPGKIKYQCGPDDIFT